VKANVYVPPASIATRAVASTQGHVAAASSSSSDSDWGSAGIGAGAAMVAALAGFAAAVGVRRRRPVAGSSDCDAEMNARNGV
jgi:uncharacterized membrane protein